MRMLSSSCLLLSATQFLHSLSSSLSFHWLVLNLHLFLRWRHLLHVLAKCQEAMRRRSKFCLSLSVIQFLHSLSSSHVFRWIFVKLRFVFSWWHLLHENGIFKVNTLKILFILDTGCFRSFVQSSKEVHFSSCACCMQNFKCVLLLRTVA